MDTATIPQEVIILREEILSRIASAVVNCNRLADASHSRGFFASETRLRNKARGFQMVADKEGDRLTHADSVETVLVLAEFIRLSAEFISDTEEGKEIAAGMLFVREWLFEYLR